MRSTWKVLGAAASLVLVPQLAAADMTIDEKLELMQQRMSQLEDQLQATNDDLQAANSRVEEQEQVLESAGLNEGGAVSGLSSFLSETDFYGWVNVSYTQGIRGDSDSAIGQNAATSYSYHPDNMGFAVNQVWFGMDHASTEESRAGFHVDMLFGKDGGVVGNLGVSSGAAGGCRFSAIGCPAPDNSFELFTAYVSYLAPLGNGIMFQGGKLPTLIGAEVLNTTGNFNITRGLTWGLQPVNLTGMTMATDLGAGFSVTAGVLNDAFSTGSRDTNQDKSVTGQVKWESDMVSAAASVNWGTDDGTSLADNTTSNTGILDALVTVDPTDNLSFYVNYDYLWNHTSGAADAPDIHAVSVAGRWGITDATGVAARAEYVYVDSVSADGWSVTGTVDHHLTDNLLLRAEYRYDGNNADVFLGKGLSTYDDQHVFIVDATYEF